MSRRAKEALARTPAPDLPALAAKIGAMRAQQLHELEGMEGGCFDLLAEDVRRLGG